MPTHMGVKHIVKPKLKTPKTSVKRITAYKVTMDTNGKPSVIKNDYRRIIRNIIKG